MNGCTGETETESPYLSGEPYRPRARGWGARLSSVRPLRFTDGCLADTELWSVVDDGHCPFMASLNLDWLVDKVNIVAGD